MIDSAFIGAVGWTADGKVPFEEIVLERRREAGDRRGGGRVSLTSNGWALYSYVGSLSSFASRMSRLTAGEGG